VTPGFIGRLNRRKKLRGILLVAQTITRVQGVPFRFARVGGARPEHENSDFVRRFTDHVAED